MLEKIGVKLSDYYSALSVVISFHILSAVFTIISIPMVIPFFHILFYGNERINDDQVSGLELRIRTIIQSIIESQGISKAVMWICVGFILIFFFKNLFRYFALYFMTPIRSRIVRDMRQKVYDSYLIIPFLQTKELQKGNLLSIMMTDVQEVEWMLRHSLETMIKSPLIIIGSIVFMLYLDVRLSLFVLVLLVITVIVIGGISRALKQESASAQAALGELHSVGEETLSSQTIIRAFTAESYMSSHFGRINDQYKRLADKVLRRKDLASPLSEFMGVSIVAVLLWYGADKVFDRVLTPEAFFAFLFAFFQVIEPSKSFAAAYYNVQKGRGAYSRILRLLNQVKPDEDKRSSKTMFTESLIFQNVSYAYSSAERPVLREVSLTCKKAEIITIEGPSGVGKTTLINLLLQFITPTSGRISLDSIDITAIQQKSLRGMFAIVDQHVSLMHNTIAHNVAFGQGDYEQHRVIKALQDAFALDFVSAMPEGILTIIGEQGMKLSGGQRQRLALARAFYAAAPILILDEATSSVDHHSESLIKQALLEMNQKEKLTILIITHSSSISDIAHKSYRLSEGRLHLLD